MATIPSSVIDEIKQRADIVQVVSGYIPLKKAGANYRALCPFHEEKTPSFNVNPQRGIFHCFGCGEGGNAITFVMKYEGVSFPEAVRLLADSMGIVIETKPGRDEGDIEKVYQAMEKAAAFYHKRLMAADRASDAARYLEKRGVSPEMVETFRLGYAPEGWDTLYRYLRKAGFDQRILEKAGLCKQGTAGPIDRFRGRLMFPICNMGGKVIAFGGRLIESGDGGEEGRFKGPKYLNSPETPIYHKSRVLYGLHLAQGMARREDLIVLVEGYMDVIALRSAGVENCAAVSGVAFTPKQAEAVGRICSNVVVLFDADAAGVEAARKSVGILLDQGLKVRALSLEGAKDPDEYVAANGPEKFRELVAKAPPFAQFVINAAMARANLSEVEGRVRAAREVIPFIARIKDDMERSEYTHILAERSGLDDAVLRKEVARAGGAVPSRQVSGAKPARGDTSSRFQAERILLRILLDRPEYLDDLASSLGAADFKDELHREMFEAMLAARERGLETASDVMELAQSEVARKGLAGLSMEKGLYDESAAEKAASDCARVVRFDPEERKRRRREQVDAVKARLEKEGGADKKVVDSD